MEKARTVKLCFRRQDGRRDWTTVEHCTLGEARRRVQSSFERADRLYTEADICIESVYTETIPCVVADVELASLTDSSGLPQY